MFELLIELLIKVLGKILPTAVSWFYKPEKLNKGIKVRIRGEGDGVAYFCGELPKVNIWVEVSNLTPFTIEIDRIYGQLSYGCAIGEFIHLKRHIVPPADEKLVLVEMTLNEHQENHIRKNLGKVETKLFLNAYINSKIHNLELTREINTNNVRLVNCVNICADI